MKGIYITGTDTGVGKTLVTCALARVFCRRGLSAGVAKPFASGSMDDTRLLKKSSRVRDSLEAITPFYFKYPLAPRVSLELEKRSVNPRDVKAKLRPLIKKYELLLVEGIGGAAVPIARNYDALDVAKDLGLSVVIVSRLSLGTLNHTYLTVEYIRKKRLKIEGIILNTYPSSRRGLAEKTNPREIARMTRAPVIGIFPFVKKKGLLFDHWADLAEKHIALGKLL